MKQRVIFKPKEVTARFYDAIAEKLAPYWNVDLLEIHTALGKYLYVKKRPGDTAEWGA